MEPASEIKLAGTSPMPEASASVRLTSRVQTQVVKLPVSNAQKVSASTRLGELRLFVACHDWIIALNAENVDRIMEFSNDALHAEDSVDVSSGFLGMLTRDGQIMPAWDLGRVLGLGELKGAWVLMRRGSQLMAIRTGTCLSVGPLAYSAVQTLPPGIFSAPDRQFFSGSFNSAPVVHSRGNFMFAGLVFDPSILWSLSAGMMSHTAGASLERAK